MSRSVWRRWAAGLVWALLASVGVMVAPPASAATHTALPNVATALVPLATQSIVKSGYASMSQCLAAQRAYTSSWTTITTPCTEIYVPYRYVDGLGRVTWVYSIYYYFAYRAR